MDEYVVENVVEETTEVAPVTTVTDLLPVVQEEENNSNVGTYVKGGLALIAIGAGLYFGGKKAIKWFKNRKNAGEIVDVETDDTDADFENVEDDNFEE